MYVCIFYLRMPTRASERWIRKWYRTTICYVIPVKLSSCAHIFVKRNLFKVIFDYLYLICH
jgi:hypothetical protein